jgi:hypothetical protein
MGCDSEANVTDPYSWWHRGLALTSGERALTREEMQHLGLTHEPGCGFFQRRCHYTRLIKDDTWGVAAIWPLEGALKAIARHPSPLVEVNAEDIWIGCASWPISEARFRALTNGQQ